MSNSGYVVHVFVHGEWVTFIVDGYNFITVGHDRYDTQGRCGDMNLVCVACSGCELCCKHSLLLGMADNVCMH